MPLVDTRVRYVSVTPELFVERYTDMGDYDMALKTCNYFKLDIEQLLTSWACMKVS